MAPREEFGAADEDAARTTLGVEEEFLLVDTAGSPVARAEAVLALVRAEPGPTLWHAELFQTQVEAATGVCRSLDEVAAQLVAGRRLLARAASTLGVRVVATGVPPMGDMLPARTEGARFAAIEGVHTGLIRDYQACGCHVHVGVPDRETAVGVLNHVAPWLPTLLALSVNSPLRHGRDQGYQSWRAVEQSRFPGSGLPPWCTSAAEYDRAVERLVDCGVLIDDRMTFWFARLSPHLPTVEFRAADTTVEAWESVLQAALSRALVRTAVEELAVGREGPRLDPQMAAAAVWSAARYGVDGPAVHPVDGVLVTGHRMVAELLAEVTPALEDAGDLAFVRVAWSLLRLRGTGAELQRAAGPGAVVAMLADRLVEGVDLDGVGTQALGRT
ncbi:carboxylate-amine ligase [Actinokineospora alba]|uniref:Putative glutamate--cysteine ligase 2 n=1 Tax=Actinokineospora alba TaxID=504798 RepID=A0A1H0TUU7_9PSEU|nr:YbdK family carboxylate-amine ligase [Actinokineospora alba]TDP70730.1 carboxylate-amine ligase [Actinokineospora alba]SDJ14744.1 carboxylate-amine ligase [Actinokineospora alba]SDP57749.1 carboxylate-amine ligase [Actinokineospora alba]